MKPIEFEGQNRVYNKPIDMTDDECSSLPVNQSGNTIVSCWELNENDIKDIVKNKKIWLGVVSYIQPPVFLSALEPYQVSQEKFKDKE